MNRTTEDDCLDRRHWEYHTWPISLPTPRAFRRGKWPRSGSQADRMWAWLRHLGLIRIRHIQAH